MASSEIDFDSPAIRALGSFFRLTEVLLWDDVCPSDNVQVSSYPKHIRFKYDSDGNGDGHSAGEISSNISMETTEDSIVTEDAELTHQMRELGLPLSFQTSKQRSGQTGKGKATQLKNQCNQKKFEDQGLESAGVSADCLCHTDSQENSSNSSSLSLSNRIEPSCSVFAIDDDMIRLSNFSKGDKAAGMSVGPVCSVSEDLSTVSDAIEKHIRDRLSTTLQVEHAMISVASGSNLCTGNTCPESYKLDDNLEKNQKVMDISLTEQVDVESCELGRSVMQTEEPWLCNTAAERKQVADLSMESQNMLVHVCNESGNIGSTGTLGDWSAFWDSYYMRYYFFNAKTQESTWHPPLGMENFAVGDVSCMSGGSNEQLFSGVYLDPAVSSRGREKADRCELVDRSNSDEQTVASLWAQWPSSGDLSSASALPDDDSYTLKTVDFDESDGNCQDEILLDSSMDVIALCSSSKKERKKADSGGICSGLKSKDIVLSNVADISDSCENSNRNSGGNVIAEMSNLSNCLSTAANTACDGDFISQTYVEGIETAANDFCMQDLPVTTKRKKTRRNRTRKKLFNEYEGDECQTNNELDVDITKYWWQRYLLFSRFDHGIKMDTEGWFSVTPEAIARHQASHWCAGVVIDCFAGVGGNAIQFAKKSKRVIALDIDPRKIDCARHNASIYGVEDRIDFILGDSFSLASKLKADAVFLSPPWGGPDYAKVNSYDIDMLQPYDGKFLFNTFKEVASMIIMFLPRNINVAQLAELAFSANPRWLLEVERNFLNDKLKGVTAYFSKTSEQNG